VLVMIGAVVGACSALDGANCGSSVDLVEARDVASGTSSRKRRCGQCRALADGNARSS